MHCFPFVLTLFWKHKWKNKAGEEMQMTVEFAALRKVWFNGNVSSTTSK